MLLNTAVSVNWGFPECSPGCDCDCFDASDPKCECAVDPGFSGVLPADFVFDSVRARRIYSTDVCTVYTDFDISTRCAAVSVAMSLRETSLVLDASASVSITCYSRSESY